MSEPLSPLEMNKLDSALLHACKTRSCIVMVDADVLRRLVAVARHETSAMQAEQCERMKDILEGAK